MIVENVILEEGHTSKAAILSSNATMLNYIIIFQKLKYRVV